MISLRRIFGLMLLFLFFEAVVAVVTTVAWPAVSVFLACVAMTALAVGVWVAFALVTRFMMRPRVPPAPAQMKVATLPNPKSSAGDDSFSLEMTALVREANRRLVGVAQVNGKREQPTVASLPLFLVVGSRRGREDQCARQLGTRATSAGRRSGARRDYSSNSRVQFVVGRGGDIRRCFRARCYAGGGALGENVTYPLGAGTSALVEEDTVWSAGAATKS